jgi:hypothetical protein
MRQHSKVLEGSTKSRRKHAWTRGLEIFKEMMLKRHLEQRPFERGESRRMFVAARQQARVEYDKKTWGK